MSEEIQQQEQAKEILPESEIPAVFAEAPTTEAGTRYHLTVDMLIAVVILCLAVMVMSALSKPVPDFISGVVVGGFMLMLQQAYSSYFKAREEQAKRI